MSDRLRSIMNKYPYLTGACEINVGHGWYEILSDMLEEIGAVSRKVQLKKIVTRNGVLRTMVDTYGPDIPDKTTTPAADNPKAVAVDLAISKAEQISETVCQTCGAPGSMISNGRHATVLCYEHRVPFLTMSEDINIWSQNDEE